MTKQMISFQLITHGQLFPSCMDVISPPYAQIYLSYMDLINDSRNWEWAFYIHNDSKFLMQAPHRIDMLLEHI